MQARRDDGGTRTDAGKGDDDDDGGADASDDFNIIYSVLNAALRVRSRFVFPATLIFEEISLGVAHLLLDDPLAAILGAFRVREAVARFFVHFFLDVVVILWMSLGVELVVVTLHLGVAELAPFVNRILVIIRFDFFAHLFARFRFAIVVIPSVLNGLTRKGSRKPERRMSGDIALEIAPFSRITGARTSFIRDAPRSYTRTLGEAARHRQLRRVLTDA